MRILVVTVEEKCPTVYTLWAEGYHPEIVVIDPEDIYAYGRTMAEYWSDGEGFINIEHDMAPWQGAVEALHACALTDSLCLFGYPRAAQGSLGMTRFTKELIQRFPTVNERWPKTPWNMLESAVLGKFKHVAKHQHRPNIAHMSGWFS